MARLSQGHKHVLSALAHGQRLQDHRELDGSKVYKLHALVDNTVEVIEPSVVEDLQRQAYIRSNMKFPAATYLLTDKGAAVAATLTAMSTVPLLVKVE